MLSTTESILPLLCLTVVFAGVALAIGFVTGWFCSLRRVKSTEAGEAEGSVERGKRRIANERTAMATDRLRDLAASMASDVGTHSSQVEKITQGLQSLDLTDIEATGEGLVSALSQIVAANDALQDRLAKAENQIIEQAQEIRTHESEARTDALTGLANRRAFDDEMKRRFSEWTRKATPLSLLILDIDFFKKFNDTHGHQAGDEVLRCVGKKLAETVREMDLACRYGGEEFAVVMPATTSVDGKVGAERVRKAIEGMTVTFEGKNLKVTASVGLAQVNNSDDCGRVLQRADKALYQSKAAGRNCGHLHDGQRSVPFLSGKEKTKVDPLAQAMEPVVTQTLDQLPNRTKFADELRRRTAESHRTEAPLAVVIVEVGGYGDIKREFGAAVSGMTLDSVAQFLKNSLRELDLLARIAENHFAVMLPESSKQEALETMERAIQALDHCSLPVGDGNLDLQIGFGVAEIQPTDTVETLVGRAEKHLVANQKAALAMV